jgi:hypothetical protein
LLIEQLLQQKTFYLFIDGVLKNNVSRPGYITVSFGMTGDVELETLCKKEVV